MRYRSAINAIITAAFITFYLLMGDRSGFIILGALILFFVLASTYAGVWVAIQIVKEIFGNWRRRL
jgi:hypothetical protein